MICAGCGLEVDNKKTLGDHQERAHGRRLELKPPADMPDLAEEGLRCRRQQDLFVVEEDRRDYL